MQITDYNELSEAQCRAGARTLIGGGGCIFIYSGYARLISFEINFITKETSRAEPSLRIDGLQNLNI